MTNRVFDTAIDQAVDVAQGAVHAIGDSISDLLPSQLVPSQLLPSRKSASKDRGRLLAIFSTVAIVGLGVMIMLAKRRSASNVHRDGSAYEETAKSAMVNDGTVSDRVMAAADRANGEPAATRA